LGRQECSRRENCHGSTCAGKMISVLRGGHEIGTSVIVYGADRMASPLGRFPIISKYRDYHSRAYDAPMPYSMFITRDGVALHGSPMSSRHATHGCIGLPIGTRLLFATARRRRSRCRQFGSSGGSPVRRRGRKLMPL
jgi:hypothetical protein